MADDKKNPDYMPSEENRERVADIIHGAISSARGERGLGLIRLKHKATGAWHTILVVADDGEHTTYPYAIMMEEERPLSAYELPPGIVELDTSPEKTFESKSLDPNDPVAIADAMLASVFGKKPN